MQRYFLNIFNDLDVIDEEGVELPDLEAAKAEAARGARNLVAESIIEGRPIFACHRVEIVDAAGQLLHSVYFGDVIDLRNSLLQRVDTAPV